MRVNRVSICRHGKLKDLHFENFQPGPNLLSTTDSESKSDLNSFVENIFFPTPINSDQSIGSLYVEENGQSFELTLKDEFQYQRPILPNSLSKSTRDIFRRFYCLDANDNLRECLSGLIRDLNSRFDLSANQSLRIELEAKAKQLDYDLERLDHLIESKVKQVESVDFEIANLEIEHQRKKNEVQSRINHIRSKIDANLPHSIRTDIKRFDQQISELRLRIDASTQQVQINSANFDSRHAEIIYRLLDQIDQDLESWQSVQSTIQSERIALRDEMVVWNQRTIDATEHPFHTTKKLINMLQSKIVGFNNSISESLTKIEQSEIQSTVFGQSISTASIEMQQDLQSICDEMADQFQHIRHESAKIELKRLRQIYSDITKIIDSFVDRRKSLIFELKHLDAPGAAAIEEQHHDFVELVKRFGYFQARKKWIGEFKQPVELELSNSQSAPKAELVYLEKERAEKVRKLVQLENAETALQDELEMELRNLNQIGIDERMNDLIASKLSSQKELEQLRQRRSSTSMLVPNDQSKLPQHTILQKASEFVRLMTSNRLHEIRLLDRRPGVAIIDSFNSLTEFEDLKAGSQIQTMLSLCLAAILEYRKKGILLPVILTDVFDNVEPAYIAPMVKVLQSLTTNEIQFFLIDSNLELINLCHQQQIPVFDLPVPLYVPRDNDWNTDRSNFPPIREPNFLTPFTTRQDKQDRHPVGYPMIKYPAVHRNVVEEENTFEYRSASQNPTTKMSYQPSVQRYSNGIDESTELFELNFAQPHIISAMRDVGIRCVGDILEFSPTDLANQLVDLNLPDEQYDYWQATLWLLNCVPALSMDDAEILMAVGINEPEQLENTHCQQLVDRISKFLNSSDGRNFVHRGRQYDRELINLWYDSLNETRSRWRMPSGYSRRTRWNRRNNSFPNKMTQRADRPNRQWPVIDRPNQDQEQSSIRRTDIGSRDRRPKDQQRSRIGQQFDRSINRSKNRTLTDVASMKDEFESNHRNDSSSSNPATVQFEFKFYLNSQDDLEAAPSIGPKTAERFQKVGIFSVAQFLAQTAETIAPKLNYKRISIDVVRQWQQQARLVCRVPNLRGHDAQLLVACGITEAEDLAGRTASGLFAIIEPFAQSKDGLKIIRGGKQPDLEEIKDWIAWAQESRSLQAA